MSERTSLGIVEMAILEALQTNRHLKCSKALARVEERIGLAPGYAWGMPKARSSSSSTSVGRPHLDSWRRDGWAATGLLRC